MSELKQYRKKPVVISASQWFKNGDHPDDYRSETTGLDGDEQRVKNWEGEIVRYYRHPEVSGETTCRHCAKTMHVHGWIDTLEGGHIVCPGDWIITGIKGEYYPCKPDVFAATYEPADTRAALPDDLRVDVLALCDLVEDIGIMSLAELDEKDVLIKRISERLRKSNEQNRWGEIMNIELGLYKTTEELRLRMGVTIFTLPEGSEVSITQLDETGGRVMLHSGRHCDWVYKTIMKYLEKVDEV